MARRSFSYLLFALACLLLNLAACGGGGGGAPAPTPNPVPSISSLAPSSATAGGTAFTLTVNGSGFVSTSVVRWNGSNRSTTFASSAQLQAAINGSDIAAAGSAQVTVFSPTPGGGTSNAVTFPFDNPVPTVTSLSPSSATAGGSAFTLTVDGSGFVATSVVRWNGMSRTTTFVNSTQLTASILASDIASPGTAQVDVFNPTPGGGASQSLPFAITGTIRVSVASDGTQGNFLSQSISPFAVSATGRFVAFESDATNLVAVDTNATRDIFVRDTCEGTPGCTPSTSRVSVASDGTEANSFSLESGSLSGDGRFVAFRSLASNLVGGDTNGSFDIFVHDRDADADGVFDETGPGERATVRVSVASDGIQGNNSSSSPAIGANGRFVVFESFATNLVAGDTNGFPDIFVHDRDADADGVFDETGPGERATVRVSVASDGTQANGGSRNPTVSANGRRIAFTSDADNLVASDTNLAADIFWHDRDADADGIFDETGPGERATVRVSIASDLSQANSDSALPSLSTDGRFVAFESLASNLVTGDTNSATDIFVRDTCVGGPGGCIASTVRVSVASDGTEANAFSSGAALSGGRFVGDPAAGRFVAFESIAFNLVASDTNGVQDVFVHDRDTDADGIFDEPGAIATLLVSVASDGTQALAACFAAQLSADGRFVAFTSDASNLIAGDPALFRNVYRRGPLF